MADTISPDESLRRLRVFLGQVKELLRDLTADRASLIPGRHHGPMQAAWVIVERDFDVVMKELTMPAARKHMTELETLGLTGDPLVFKLSIYQHAYDELNDHRARFPHASPDTDEGWRLTKWVRRKWRKLLGCTFKAADVILDSLGDIPGFPSHSIKELKGASEAGLELGDVLDETAGQGTEG
jgi:hypothetical protein